jgi:hypothetical protein
LLLTRRGVALSAAALGTALSSQAVSAAPAGMAVLVGTSALASAAASGSTALTFLQIMSMTKVKITVATVVIAAGLAVPWTLHHRAQSELRAQNETLHQQLAEVERLQAENARLAKLAAAPTPAPLPASTNQQVPELMKLRGEVARLRQTASDAAAAPKTSAYTDLTQNDPEVRRMIRDQQKLGMGMIYKEFTKTAKLPKEQADKLNELLADDVMENVDHVTALLKEGKSVEQVDQLFAAQEAALMAKVQALLAPEEFAQYKDYTQNLLGHLTAQQFKAMVKSDTGLSDDQMKQLFQAVQEEGQLALANAGLRPDFQVVPILNFRNLTSEQEAEKSVQRLSDIYARVAARAQSFLGPEALQKFEEFRTLGVNNSRTALAMNRKMMAPPSR